MLYDVVIVYVDYDNCNKETKQTISIWADSKEEALDFAMQDPNCTYTYSVVERG